MNLNCASMTSYFLIRCEKCEFLTYFPFANWISSEVCFHWWKTHQIKSRDRDPPIRALKGPLAHNPGKNIYFPPMRSYTRGTFLFFCYLFYMYKTIPPVGIKQQMNH